MTFQDYVGYFSDMLKADKVELENLDVLVKNGIRLGIQDLMGASNWTFKQFVRSLSITATADSYDLPDDFEGFKDIREEETQTGMKLVYKPKQEFDQLIPKQSTYASGNPQVFTVYADVNTNKKKISFFPRPSGAMTLYLIYLIDANNPESALAKIPSKAQAALEACMAKHVYPYGHPGRLAAAQLAEREIKKLWAQDKFDMSDWTKFLDRTDTAIAGPSVPYWTT